MSRIITFYSYKGGVGRTFALANIAVLLARRGKRVLVMDWDLEAPGLHRYFKKYINSFRESQKGLIHLLCESENDREVSWESFLERVTIDGCAPVDLLSSGDRAVDYVEKVRRFSWSSFFENESGGDLLNRWRVEWKNRYDYILVDSRTGITDTGGVCTIYLPDILVLVFSANEQSFERGVQIATGVQAARRNLAVPRPPLAVLPLPGRFDGRDEVDEAQFWLNRFAEELKPFYDDWLPKELKPRQILELTKIPYVTKFSFGEPLPVITQGTTDPEFPGFYLENVARLLLSDFDDAMQIVSPETAERSDLALELREALSLIPLDEQVIESAITALEDEVGPTARLSEFLTEAGTVLLRQQRYTPAERYLRRALLLSGETLGLASPPTLSCMENLAALLSATGRLSEAENLYRQIVSSEKDTDPFTRIFTYINLANLCRQMGRLDEALSWYQRALSTSDIGDYDNPTVFATLNNLAALYQEMGRNAEAIQYSRRALHTAESRSHEGDPSVIGAYNNLAALYQKTGRIDEAVELYKRSLNMAERSSVFGDSTVLAAYNNLAALHQKLGRTDEAIKFYQEALSIVERTAKPGDPSILTAHNKLADLYQKNGRTNEAIKLYRHALHSAEEGATQGDPAIFSTYNKLAAAYSKTGRIKEAIDVSHRAIEIAERNSRDGDPSALAAYNTLALLYQKVGRVEEAIDLYKYAVARVEKTARPGDTAVLSLLNNLASVYRKAGQNEKAIEVYKRALTSAEKGERPPDSTIMTTYNNLSDVYKEVGDFSRATKECEKALHAAQEIFGTQSAQVASQFNNLAELFLDRGYTDDAERWLWRAMEIHRNVRAKRNPAASRTRRILANLLESSGRSEEAAEIAEVKKIDVFVSYSQKDTKAVSQLVEELVGHKLSVWFDQWELRPGDPIVDAVTKAISSARALVFCIGSSEPNSWMQDAALKFIENESASTRLVVPIILPGGDPGQIPFYLSNYQFLDLREGVNDRNIKILLNTISHRPYRL